MSEGNSPIRKPAEYSQDLDGMNIEGIRSRVMFFISEYRKQKEKLERMTQNSVSASVRLSESSPAKKKKTLFPISSLRNIVENKGFKDENPSSIYHNDSSAFEDAKSTLVEITAQSKIKEQKIAYLEKEKDQLNSKLKIIEARLANLESHHEKSRQNLAMHRDVYNAIENNKKSNAKIAAVLKKVLSVREELAPWMRNDQVNQGITKFYEDKQEKLQMVFDDKIIWNTPTMTQECVNLQLEYIAKLRDIVQNDS